MGKTPHSGRAISRLTLQLMKSGCRKKFLTFGEFIACVYDGCGKRKAMGVVRLAVKARLIEFHGQQHLVIS